MKGAKTIFGIAVIQIFDGENLFTNLNRTHYLIVSDTDTSLFKSKRQKNMRKFHDAGYALTKMTFSSNMVWRKEPPKVGDRHDLGFLGIREVETVEVIEQTAQFGIIPPPNYKWNYTPMQLEQARILLKDDHPGSLFNLFTYKKIRIYGKDFAKWDGWVLEKEIN